jgi:hypothetical protein
VKSDIEFGCAVIETLILNESDERIARYMSGALEEMQRALSYLSYAEFEMSTRPNIRLRVKKYRKLRFHMHSRHRQFRVWFCGKYLSYQPVF